MSDSGRIMAIDHGEVRLGIALSDPLKIIASPYTIIKRSSQHDDFGRLSAIIRDEDVRLIVVGLPTDSEGNIGVQARSVIRWVHALATVTSLPIRLWDESYSSLDAIRINHQQRKPRRGPLDDIAAALILQSYLEARGLGYEPGHSLETLQEDP